VPSARWAFSLLRSLWISGSDVAHLAAWRHGLSDLKRNNVSVTVSHSDHSEGHGSRGSSERTALAIGQRNVPAFEFVP
jgi:hypothetical protein